MRHRPTFVRVAMDDRNGTIDVFRENAVSRRCRVVKMPCVEIFARVNERLNFELYLHDCSELNTHPSIAWKISFLDSLDPLGDDVYPHSPPSMRRRILSR